jgi:Tfp pilus assembly pilus retraction ATPase PilT
MQVGKAHGMVLLDDSLQNLVNEGVIDIEEARRHAINPGRFNGK